jgi:hypothetical protein
VLAINEDTGVVDVAMDHVSPDTLYAAAYQRRRTVFGFAGSGPDGGIYKTTDGGATWKKLVKGLPWDPDPPQGTAGGPAGLPAGVLAAMGITLAEAPAAARPAVPADTRQEIGRIGLNVYRGDTHVVYALVEHENGGIFRSDDKGESWTRMSETNPRPMYYSKVHIDPTNDQRVWVLGASMYYSEDGGKTFVTNHVQRIHGDFHAMWIDPANSQHIVLGSDGGIHWSFDRGRTWDFVNTMAIGQFYEIGLDMRQPYFICGGLQDNNTWCGPSTSMNPRGIANSDWFTIGGGDGFYAQIDPTTRTPSTPSRRTATCSGATCAPASRAASVPSPPKARRRTASSGTRRSSSRPTTRRPSTTPATSCSSRGTAATGGRGSAPT